MHDRGAVFISRLFNKGRYSQRPKGNTAEEPVIVSATGFWAVWTISFGLSLIL